MTLLEKISLYLVIGCLLGLAGWSQRKKITYSFTLLSFLMVVIGWPAVLGWVCAQVLLPPRKGKKKGK